MVQEKMTIHQALSELKILDKRIEKAIDEGIYCVANKHSNEKINGITVKEYCEIMKGFDNKVTDLIRRRNAMRRAVQQSNAVTKVLINKEEYTVAVAIEMKNHGIELEEMYHVELQSQYILAQDILKAKNGQELETRADRYIESLYSNKDAGKVDGSKANEDRETFIRNNQYELVDPLKVLDRIDALEERISKFKAEVDAALSVSNAMTEITISY